jgi:hypothetical protein
MVFKPPRQAGHFGGGQGIELPGPQVYFRSAEFAILAAKPAMILDNGVDRCGKCGRAAGEWSMRRYAVCLWLVALLALTGCITDNNLEPSQSDMKAQWDARNVFPRDYKSDLLAFLRTYLNDPGHIRSAELEQPRLKTFGPGERYISCVSYNARIDGKYAGPHVGAAVYVGGKLDHFLDGPKQTKDVCKDAAYAAFPELERLTR